MYVFFHDGVKFSLFYNNIISDIVNDIRILFRVLLQNILDKQSSISLKAVAEIEKIVTCRAQATTSSGPILSFPHLYLIYLGSITDTGSIWAHIPYVLQFTQITCFNLQIGQSRNFETL